MRTISRENEIKKAEGQSVINAVKVFDKSYPLEVHCNTLGKKNDLPIFRHMREQAKHSEKM